jgi:hypothetical protein
VRQLNVSVFLDLTKALGLRSRPELAPWSAGLGWLQAMAELLATAAATDAGGKAGQWKDCLSNLRRVVRERVTRPFIQNMQPPGQDVPGLTFEVRVCSVCAAGAGRGTVWALAACTTTVLPHTHTHAVMHTRALQVSPSDSPELRLLRPTVLQAAGLLGDARITGMAGGCLRRGAVLSLSPFGVHASVGPKEHH